MTALNLTLTRAVIIALVCLGVAMTTLSCGKRGDPYRPAEVPSTDNG